MAERHSEGYEGYVGSIRNPWLRLLLIFGWLLGLFPLPQGIISGAYQPAWLAVGALVLAALLIAAAFLPLQGFVYSTRLHALVLVAIAALTLTTSLGFGGFWLLLFVFLAAACGAFVPPRWNVPAVVAVSALVGVIVVRETANSGAGAGYFSGTFAAGTVNVLLARMRELVRELRQTRADLARLAVEEERVRFAHDLHDLLGHTLSLIVVKAEAARRLAERGNSVAAAREATDIETVGRRALAEVREAVTGYRERGLASELAGARSALAGAGIEATIHILDTPLPQPADALLGRAVREAVTNVIRHSRARSCAIEVRRQGDKALLTVRDDGDGAGATGSGTGLAGLAERVAGAGGSFHAGPRPGGGFQLVLAVPVQPATDVLGNER